jgi:hypothetical protein
MNKTIYIDLETQVFLYLDRLRESGITNMYGAGPYVEDEFGLGRQEAGELLIEWMTTFESRHPTD